MNIVHNFNSCVDTPSFNISWSYLRITRKDHVMIISMCLMLNYE
jgi:hypothetical protein